MRLLVIHIILHIVLIALIIGITWFLPEKLYNLWFIACFIIGFLVVDKLKYASQFLDDIIHKIEKMKLAALYSVFNGTELLAKSIEQIYNDVDIIILCYQNISYKGNRMSDFDKETIKMLSFMDKVFLSHYPTDLNLNTKDNERQKHNLMIQTAKVHACTHFVFLDCDHYYMPEQFRTAKKKAEKYDVTATAMYTYYKNPTWQLNPIEDYFMPFICKMYPNTEITERLYNFLTDPSFCVNTRDKQYVFDVDEIMLHHYSMIRTDIEQKFKNAAASVNWSDKIPDFVSEYHNAKVGSTISYFRGREIIEVPNYFNI